MKKKGKRKAARVIAVVLVLLFSVVVFFGYRFYYLYLSSAPMAFDAELLGKVPFYRMVDDLVESDLLEGMTREEVTALLGEGREHEPMSEYADRGYSVRYEYTLEDAFWSPEWERGYLIVIYNWDDICMGCTTDWTCPY